MMKSTPLTTLTRVVMRTSIFQQIVLPYLSNRSLAFSTHFNRHFSSSIARARAASNADASTSSTSIPHDSPKRWEYVPPILPVSYNSGHDPPQPPARASSSSRVRLTPAVQANPSRPSQTRAGSAGEVLAFLKRLEEGKGTRQATLMMALEKIASIPDQLEEREAMEEERVAKQHRENEERRLRLLRAKKGRIRVEDGASMRSAISPNPEPGEGIPLLPVDPPPQTPAAMPVNRPSPQPHSHGNLAKSLSTHHFPPIIHTLLRTRLYRLTVYHLLQTPEFAVDQPLLDQVAEYMTLDGAGKLARRLAKGWDGTLSSDPHIESNPDSENWVDDAPLPHRTPFGSTGVRQSPDAWRMSRRAAARPIPINPTLSALTANYNAHLARALLSPKKGSSSSSSQTDRSYSSNPLTPLNNMLTVVQPLQRPSGGMRQLRQLIQKIERLEKHRSFRPDWVTANLVVKCWMSCLMARGEGWRSGTAGGAAKEAEIDRKAELQGLFGFVKALYEKGLEDQAGWEEGLRQEAKTSHVGSASSDGPMEDAFPISRQRQTPSKASLYPYPQALSYVRHVRPFANDIIRAFRHIDDQRSAGRVIEWQREMRERIEGTPILPLARGKSSPDRHDQRVNVRRGIL